jgi:cysteine synthase
VRALITLLSRDDTSKLTTGDIGPFRLTDAEAVSMARFLVQRDGLFLGSSSAVNLVACVKFVRKMGWCNGEKIVTVL